MGVGAILWTLAVTVVGGLLVLVIWHKFLKQPEIAPEPTRTPEPRDMGMRLLKAMREQIEGKRGYIVDAYIAARGLGMDFGSEEVDRHLHELVRAGYLEEDHRPAMTAQGVYKITFDGIEAADAH